jgi:outer membrane protein OmpA-like peptidoglycan-associated protein
MAVAEQRLMTRFIRLCLIGVMAIAASTARADPRSNDAVPVASFIVTTFIVSFDFGDAIIDANAQEQLARALTFIRQRRMETVLIVGATDAIEDASLDPMLSSRRVEVVKAWFIANGIDAALLQTSAQRAAHPIAWNQKDGEDNPAGRAKNRRVQIEMFPLRGPHSPGDPDA